MAKKPLSTQLKQSLIQSSLKRKLKQTDSGKPLNIPRATRASRNNISFEEHPGYKQLQVMREGGEKLDAPDPFFRVHDGIAGATTSIDGQTYINFASYNYLGFSGHPAVNEAAKNAIDLYGTSVSASRAVSGERAIHQALEANIAELYGVDSAVAFVSGHATNVTTISYLMNAKDLIIHDELIHNSSLVGAQLSGSRRIAFKHNDYVHLEKLLNEQRDNYNRVLIIVEGLYSMDGDYPDLIQLIAIKNKYAAWLMVDEAHSLGVMGDSGFGLREHFNVKGTDVDIWMGTLSKSFAGCGGYIAGSSALCDMLRYFSAGFLYSVGMAAQVAAPALQALELLRIEKERVKKLHDISAYFLQALKSRGYDTGSSVGLAVIPVIVGSSVKAVRMSGFLYEQGINVQPILYPAVPERSARLRFFMSTEHTTLHIDQTIQALEACD